VIFLTVGSHEPFDRLIAAVDGWCGRTPGAQVFAQITERAAYQPKHLQWVAQLDQAAYRRKCLEASCLISHAGMGSIITALELGKPIVVMPRRGHLHETRNDHQWSTVREFRGKPGIFVADDETVLDAEIENALLPRRDEDRPFLHFAQDRLISFLSAALKG
jgi:UDP-N-acetylglucosamine transferase subunit ALG13